MVRCSKCDQSSAESGILDTGFGKAVGTKNTTVAASTGVTGRIGIVAAVCQAVVEAESGATSDDVAFGDQLQRCVYPKPLTVDAASGRERRQLLECCDELRPAVGIARVIQRVHTDKDVVRPEYLGPSERQRQKDRVARGDIG